MNKILFNYCQKHLRLKDKAELKENASLRYLADHYNIGYIKNHRYYFNTRDKCHLIEVVAQELNGALLSDDYPDLQTRLQRAKHDRNEKENAFKVSEDFVLLNSLTSLRLNQHVTPINKLSSLGQFICASEIQSIEHQQIVLVENLVVMANLHRLRIPVSLKEALWLYRGDIQAHKQTGTAYQFFRNFQTSNQLICFSDIDPKGLEICLTSGAAYCLTLTDAKDLNIVLQGHENEWFNQTKSISYLNNKASLPDYFETLFQCMKNSQSTLKQEHILAHELTLALYPLK